MPASDLRRQRSSACTSVRSCRSLATLTPLSCCIDRRPGMTEQLEGPVSATTENAVVRSVARNALFSYVAFGVQVGLGIFLTPALLHGLGQQRYGTYIVLVTLASYVGIAEAGIGNA